MTFSRPVRKAMLAFHLTASVGWVGGVVGYLALSAAATISTDAETIRGAWIAMEILGWYALVPLAITAFLTGTLMAIGTPWGLLRHYWVVISLILTLIAVVVLVVHMPDVSATVDIARSGSDAQLIGLGGDTAHPAVGLVILLVVEVLNIYKPRGVTRYGQRRAATSRPNPTPSTNRDAKV